MPFLSHWLIPLALTTFVYLGCFYATFWIVAPFQNAVFGDIPLFASLLFLPHGVRVLSAYLYGWRSVWFLTPGVIVAQYYVYGWENGLAGFSFAPGLGAIICAPMSFALLRFFGFEMNGAGPYRFRWRYLLLVGVLASVLNALFTVIYHRELEPQEAARSILTYLIGDIGGQFVVMFLLMMTFRWARSFRGI